MTFDQKQQGLTLESTESCDTRNDCLWNDKSKVTLGTDMKKATTNDSSPDTNCSAEEKEVGHDPVSVPELPVPDNEPNHSQIDDKSELERTGWIQGGKEEEDCDQKEASAEDLLLSPLDCQQTFTSDKVSIQEPAKEEEDLTGQAEADMFGRRPVMPWLTEKIDHGPVQVQSGHRCHLCGSSTPAVKCEKCSNLIFCLSCDDMYHRHPKRRDHLRKMVDVPPPLPPPRPPPKNLDPDKVPVPPPRRRKSQRSIPGSPVFGQRQMEQKPELPKKQFPLKFGSLKRFIPRSNNSGKQHQQQPSTMIAAPQPISPYSPLGQNDYRRTSNTSMTNDGGRQKDMSYGDDKYNFGQWPNDMHRQGGGVPRRSTPTYLGPAGYYEAGSTGADQSSSDAEDEVCRPSSIGRGSGSIGGNRDDEWDRSGILPHHHFYGGGMNSRSIASLDHVPPSYGEPQSAFSTLRRHNTMLTNTIDRRGPYGYARSPSLRRQQHPHSTSVSDLSNPMMPFVACPIPQVQSMADLQHGELEGVPMTPPCGCRPHWVGPDAFGQWHPPVRCFVHSSASGAYHGGAFMKQQQQLQQLQQLQQQQPQVQQPSRFPATPTYPQMIPSQQHPVPMYPPQSSPTPPPPPRPAIQSPPPAMASQSRILGSDGRIQTKEPPSSPPTSIRSSNSRRKSKSRSRGSRTHAKRNRPEETTSSEGDYFSASESEEGEDNDRRPTRTRTRIREQRVNIDGSWECEHCTYINQSDTRICGVCCKTTGRNSVVSPSEKGKDSRPNQNSSSLNKETPRTSVSPSGNRSLPNHVRGSKAVETTKSVLSQVKDDGEYEDLEQKIDADTTDKYLARKLDSSVKLNGHPKDSRLPNGEELQSLQNGGSKVSDGTEVASQRTHPNADESRSSKPRGVDAALDPMEYEEEKQSTRVQADTQTYATVFKTKPPSPEKPYRITQEASVGTKSDHSFGARNNNHKDYYLNMEELVQRRRQESLRTQGLELVRLLRDAEQQNFTADDVQVALNHCGSQNPVHWLQDNWKNMVDTVVTLATNYGHGKKENDIGIVSSAEAKESLRLHKGNIWAAVTECVEQRQKKFTDIQNRGNYSREEVVAALTANQGVLEAAVNDLNKSSLKPFLMRIWGPPAGADNEAGPIWPRIPKFDNRDQPSAFYPVKPPQSTPGDQMRENQIYLRSNIQSGFDQRDVVEDFQDNDRLSNIGDSFDHPDIVDDYPDEDHRSNVDSSFDQQDIAEGYPNEDARSDMDLSDEDILGLEGDQRGNIMEGCFSDLDEGAPDYGLQNQEASEPRDDVFYDAFPGTPSDTNSENHLSPENALPTPAVPLPTTFSDAKVVENTMLMSTVPLPTPVAHAKSAVVPSLTSVADAALIKPVPLPRQVASAKSAGNTVMTSVVALSTPIVDGKLAKVISTAPSPIPVENVRSAANTLIMSAEPLLTPAADTKVENNTKAHSNLQQIETEITTSQEAAAKHPKTVVAVKPVTNTPPFQSETLIKSTVPHVLKSQKPRKETSVEIQTEAGPLTECQMPQKNAALKKSITTETGTSIDSDIEIPVNVELSNPKTAEMRSLETQTKLPVKSVVDASVETTELGFQKLSQGTQMDSSLQDTDSTSIKSSLNHDAHKLEHANCQMEHHVEDNRGPDMLENCSSEPSMETLVPQESEVAEDQIQNVEEKHDLFKNSYIEISDFNRRVRQLLAQGTVPTYEKAEVAIQLIDLRFEESEAFYAARECSNLSMAVSYLQQDCELCTGKFPMGKMISMLNCTHRCCRTCAKEYFTLKIKERNIMEAVCPYCNEPNLNEDDVATEYFNHLDILLKNLLDAEIHELFQCKLRDRALMSDPSFRWCVKCGSGFIADLNHRRLVCPDCRHVTCAQCRKPWEKQHDGITCERYAAWKEANDPEFQQAGLEKYLTENGIDCPKCKFRYALAKGGCMHFTCSQCKFEFCSGCGRPFRMSKKCGVSLRCEKLGLHAHHPRNCLFYLRDKEPKDLEKLLTDHNIPYDMSSEKEYPKTCPVMEQKESPDGNEDSVCGRDVEDGHPGLCRLHYVEYLVNLVNKNKLDPVTIMDTGGLQQQLKRKELKVPDQREKENDDSYREMLIQMILQDIPLELS